MRVFDLHCDTLCKHEDLDKNSLHLSLSKGRLFPVWAQVFAIWVDDLDTEIAEEMLWKTLFHAGDQFSKYARAVMLCKTKADLSKALQTQKCAAFLSIENGNALGGKLENIRKAADFGVKIITLTWNGENRLGYGAQAENKGLKPFGIEAVREMEKYKITVDASHLSARGFDDVAVISPRPFIATHSNSFPVCGHPRNLSDDQFCIIAARNGLVGINFYPLFVNGKKSATFDDLYRHISHFLDLGGETVISIGSDFDGADMGGDITDITSLPAFYEYLCGWLPEKNVDRLFFKNAYDFFMKNL